MAIFVSNREQSMTNITIPIPVELKKRLSGRALAHHTTVSKIITDAIIEYFAPLFEADAVADQTPPAAIHDIR